ncbi:ATP-dependent RNA helicase eIF4A [Sarocladium strictum]
MNLKPELLRGVYAYGFECPTPIQQCAIMPIIDGHDVIAEAADNAGKTATWVIPVLQTVRANIDACQALILAPTRELALQTQKFITAVSDFMDIRSYACVGGGSMPQYEQDFQVAPQVVVGTPGRILTMVQRNILKSANIKMFVLDDADEILARGFEDIIHDLFRLLPQPIQVTVTTSTMPQEVHEVTSRLTSQPRHIAIKKSNFRLGGMKQFYIKAEKDEDKLDIFLDLYANITNVKTITFCNKRKRMEWLAEELDSRNRSFFAMHGDMDAWKRANIMKEFRSDSAGLLIATELLARGIDVQQIPLIINYDLHDEHENYRNRVGDGGRVGHKGVVINLVTSDDTELIGKIEDFYNTEMEETTLEDLKLFLSRQEWAET